MNCSIIYNGSKYSPTEFIELYSDMDNIERKMKFSLLNKAYKNIGDHICDILFRIKSKTVKRFVEEKWVSNPNYRFLFLIGENNNGEKIMLGIAYFFVLPNRQN